MWSVPDTLPVFSICQLDASCHSKAHIGCVAMISIWSPSWVSNSFPPFQLVLSTFWPTWQPTTSSLSQLWMIWRRCRTLLNGIASVGRLPCLMYAVTFGPCGCMIGLFCQKFPGVPPLSADHRWLFLAYCGQVSCCEHSQPIHLPLTWSTSSILVVHQSNPLPSRARPFGHYEQPVI